MLSVSATAQAKAKVNLFLHVTGKREDGYHLLESLVVFPDFVTDTIIIRNSPDFSFDITGPFAEELSKESTDSNLVLMAHDLLQNFSGRSLSCSIHLDKNLPIGSGLGGGSSDAAATVKLMERYFDLNLDPDMRRHILVMLGADVPICYRAETAYFSGIGEVIEDGPKLPKAHILLVWPGVHCSTRAVFEKRSQETSPSVKRPDVFKDLNHFVSFLGSTRNDLEQAAENLYPGIKELRSWMESQPGCALARMSGSGSTIFGLFPDEKSCAAALGNIPQDKTWWAKAGKIGG